MCSVLCQFFLRERTRHALHARLDTGNIFDNPVQIMLMQ